MAEFNLSTSYQNDYEIADFVADTTWEPKNRDAAPVTGFKARSADIDTPEFITLAAGLGLSSSTAAFVVWPPIAIDTGLAIDFAPQQGDILRITDEAIGDELPGETGWIIRRFTKTVWGNWAIIVEREKVDVEDEP